jgi:flagellar biosynthesis protein
MPEHSTMRPAAVALAYAGGDVAPGKAAEGESPLAEAIVAEARRAGAPVREQPGLAQALFGEPVDQAIPASLYLISAEVLAHLDRLDRLPHPAVVGKAWP